MLATTTTLVVQQVTDQTWYIISDNIVKIILTVIGLTIAGKGLITWKKQLKGKKEFEIAYNLNYSILKLRDAIRYVRNPAIWPSESVEALKYAKIKYPEKQEFELEKELNSFVYEMRWEKIIEARTEVKSYLLGSEVLWGSRIIELIEPLNKKIGELLVSLKQTFGPREARIKDYMELHKIIYDEGRSETEFDQFGKEINEIIGKIKEYITNKIQIL